LEAEEKKNKEMMDEMEILAKEFVALKIQSHFKRKQAKIQV